MTRRFVAALTLRRETRTDAVQLVNSSCWRARQTDLLFSCYLAKVGMLSYQRNPSTFQCAKISDVSKSSEEETEVATLL